LETGITEYKLVVYYSEALWHEPPAQSHPAAQHPNERVEATTCWSHIRC